MAEPITMDDITDKLRTVAVFEVDRPILHEAIAVIERLRRERDEARHLVIEANNSLYGSQGYFHSMTGGPFDKYHLARGIEALKDAARRSSDGIR